jgi:cytochrome c oxidase cbb3-type subunit 3
MSDATSPETPPAPHDPEARHVYDGIVEHDNKLPNWWLATLVLAIIFGYGYWMYFHILKAGQLPQAEYQAELDEAAAAARLRAKAKGALTDTALVEMAASAATVAAGRATYTTSCVACHGVQAQGIIGPNLTDAYWLHGAKPTDVLRTVSTGVAAKGMPAWEPVLGADRVEEVVAFLLTLKDTNVKGKEPQGDLASAAPPAAAQP